MPTELNLSFPDADHVIVRFGPDDDGSGRLAFANPITAQNLLELQWYIETYGAHSLGDPDDAEANRIANQLPVWGKALFDAVFKEREAERRLNSFQDAEDDTRLLTVSSEHPAVLALPWELLHDSANGGGYLFMETPRISIRRRVAGATGGRKPFKPAAKDALHLLFVVSRPDDTGFLDPRADSQPVLDAVDDLAPGRVTCEFLRPPTLDALLARLENPSMRTVDIVHFDGHGVFDRRGNLPNRAAAAETMRIAKVDEILKEKKVDVPVDPDCPPNTGYLLFEKADGKPHFVSAQKLGANLHRHKVALVILSACQSAAVAEQDKDEQPDTDRPIGSVAARLTATGIPSVLAMTHSVLVHTTRSLFGEFYKELVQHKGIGEALDNARRHLANHPEKYEVQRGPHRVPLKLQDWFLPALYQQGADTALLRKTAAAPAPVATRPKSNLPKHPEGGFFGRRRDLWHIERWFAGPTLRISLTGFGGQGKTALAQEAGRWLLRTGLFEAVVFVDYSRVQAEDAVAVAKNKIGKVFDLTLLDADAVTKELQRTPTLIILDNLESLAPDSLQALLDAAVPWSEAGRSRVLCTTRRPDFGHTAYRVEGTHEHRRIQLDGLGSLQAPDDALEWCAVLMKLLPAPTVKAPQREALIGLFERVKFHPLSIRVLAQQLKTRTTNDVSARLSELLTQAERGRAGQVNAEDTPAGLLASLELSLDQLDAAAREVLPRLGVLQGGAMEDCLIAITGLGDTGERELIERALASIEAGEVAGVFAEMGRPVPPEPQLREFVADLRAQLAELPPPIANLWPGLRRQLEAAALIEAEDLPGVTVPFLRFHPTLAPMLWAQLNPFERDRLSTAHRQRYHRLSGYLYQQDPRNPHQARNIAHRELPNLLHGVHAAFDAGQPDAGDFADSVNKFLAIFGLKQEAARLSARVHESAGEVGSKTWYLAQSNRGEQLLANGPVAEAEQVFQTILEKLGDSPIFERARTLGYLSQCHRVSGRPNLAVQHATEAIAICEGLTPTNGVKRLRSDLLTFLADALSEQGKYAEARQCYEAGLKLVVELRDLHSMGVVLGQLGTLAMLQGDLTDAANRFRASLTLFEQLREPALEATSWHLLGIVFQRAKQWDEAERHYREAASIKEKHGVIFGPNGAAVTWHQLARLNALTDKPEAAETWYRKAIAAFRTSGESLNHAKALFNLAILLFAQPGRLAEARILAEEAVELAQRLDPAATELWKTYGLLAEIATQEAATKTDAQQRQAIQSEARDHRRRARETLRNFPGMRHQLQQHAPLILGTVAATQDPAQRKQLEQALPGLEQNGWQSLVAAIRRLLAGERDADRLCNTLHGEDSMVIEAILAGLRDPKTLADLLPPESPPSAAAATEA